METEKPSGAGPPLKLTTGCWLALAIAAAAYAAFVVATWSEAYIDFGDGNYMYISSRLAEGAVIYRDILAPQPPVHLFLGAAIVKFSKLIGQSSPLYFFRAFSLGLHLLTFLFVVRLAHRAWANAWTAVFAGIIFLLLPIGLWWSMAYQSEPLEIFFLVLMMNSALLKSRAADVLTGIFGALAAMTNATAAPFLLVLIIYMLVKNPRRALRIAVPSLILAGAVTVALEAWTGGHFLKTVVLDQAGTYPRGQFLRYALGKIIREGTDILLMEGAFILFALIGLILFATNPPENGLDEEQRGGLAWFAIATLCSFLFVTKGGTVDYIFCLAEPAVAIFSAGALMQLLKRSRIPQQPRDSTALPDPDKSYGSDETYETDPSHTPSPASAILIRDCALVLLALVALGRPFLHYQSLWDQSAFELPDVAHAEKEADGRPGANADQVKFWIERYSKPGDTILAPPFYAFMTGRKIWEDYSELFIWRIKDHNDREESNAKGEGWAKTKALAATLNERKLPIVIIELGQQGQLPEINQALAKNYVSVLPDPPGSYPTLNTRLGVYTPRE